MKFRSLLPILTRTFPPWFLRKVGKMVPNDTLQQQFDLVDTLTVATNGIWEEKKRLYVEGAGSGPTSGKGRDILSILRVY